MRHGGHFVSAYMCYVHARLLLCCSMDIELKLISQNKNLLGLHQTCFIVMGKKKHNNKLDILRELNKICLTYVLSYFFDIFRYISLQVSEECKGFTNDTLFPTMLLPSSNQAQYFRYHHIIAIEYASLCCKPIFPWRYGNNFKSITFQTRYNKQQFCHLVWYWSHVDTKTIPGY